ncbi:MAG: four helix bundle protein, partial [Candidatus Nealsonbacteria bacterium]|nr:four helix bundle protein [Candidatus Nealsonbacteria bacterium]
YIRDQLRRASISIVNRFFIFRKYFDERGMTPLVDQRKYPLESSWLKTSMHSIRGISPINIAEGSGKFSKGEKWNYYTIARGSAYECVSLFDLIKEENTLSEEVFRNYYLKFETISKMLMGLIKSQAC